MSKIRTVTVIKMSPDQLGRFNDLKRSLLFVSCSGKGGKTFYQNEMLKRAGIFQESKDRNNSTNGD